MLKVEISQMKKNNIKRILKVVSELSIILFGFFYVLEKFFDITISDGKDLRNIFVIFYLITGLIYYKMELKDKNKEINSLKNKLKEKD
jgi:hypothetical protein